MFSGVVASGGFVVLLTPLDFVCGVRFVAFAFGLMFGVVCFRLRSLTVGFSGWYVV